MRTSPLTMLPRMFRMIRKVTSVFWPIASRSRCLLQRKRKFRVRSFPHPSFADQSANDASPNVPNDSQGDIGVLAYCKSLMVFRAANTGITGKKCPHPSFADQSADAASANVLNASQVTFLFWPVASHSSARTLLLRTSPLTMLPRMFRMLRR